MLLVLGLLALAGCASQPMLAPSPIVSRMGAAQNRLAILRGMGIHHWVLVSEEPGVVTLKQDKRNQGVYVATVNVHYDDDSISIHYLSSHGLSCEPAGDSCISIHRAYNRWVVQLSKDIEYGVGSVLAESNNPPPAVGAGAD